MKVIGLSGGIGSGKTSAANVLRELGARVIDADRVGHDVYAPGTLGWQAVAAEFGSEVIASDGTIDRKRLGAIVFADARKLARLNALLHPLIGEAIRARIDELRAADPRTPVVVEAAVLIEAGWTDLVDEVWLVVADHASVVERLARQRGLDASAVEARVRAQLSDQERRRYADVIIENNGTLDDLRARITHLWQDLLRRS